jgi:hypothetical protein
MSRGTREMASYVSCTDILTDLPRLYTKTWELKIAVLWCLAPCLVEATRQHKTRVCVSGVLVYLLRFASVFTPQDT